MRHSRLSGSRRAAVGLSEDVVTEINIDALLASLIGLLIAAVSTFGTVLVAKINAVHRLANANLTKQTALVAAANEKIEGMHALIAELNRKMPVSMTVVKETVAQEHQPTGTEDDPLKVEIASQAKTLDVNVVKK